MKKTISLCLALTMIFALAACSNSQSADENSSESSSSVPATESAEQTNADIFRIEPETPYPTDHDTLVDLAADEQDDNARPAIKDTTLNLDQYDTIFVGYPNWWGDMPMILYTFFDTYDFSGKTIIPFNTHGGSGFSGTIGTIAELEPNAEVNEDGFTVSRNNVQEAEPDIRAWLNELGYSN